MTDQVNIPLLRKAVEWAEAEAAKPNGECAWVQQWWVIPANTMDGYLKALREKYAANYCGTTYCIAGYVCEVEGLDAGLAADQAAGALGIKYDSLNDNSPGARLFSANNTIADVRRIAEEIAGERL